MAYIELEQLKATLELTSETYADGDLTLAVNAASIAVDHHCGRSFGVDEADQTRLYVPRRPDWFEIDDLAALTSIEGGDEQDEFTVWETTDYTLLPLNANPTLTGGEPWTTVELKPNTSVNDFDYATRRQVRITGRFGWPTIPDSVNEATGILAARLLKRAREAPFGIAGIGADGFAVRVSRTDPDVMMLLAPFVRPIRLA